MMFRIAFTALALSASYVRAADDMNMFFGAPKVQGQYMTFEDNPSILVHLEGLQEWIEGGEGLDGMAEAALKKIIKDQSISCFGGAESHGLVDAQCFIGASRAEISGAVSINERMAWLGFGDQKDGKPIFPKADAYARKHKLGVYSRREY